MNLITRIVLGLIKLALVIGLTGGLIDLTRTKYQAFQSALVSDVITWSRHFPFIKR